MVQPKFIVQQFINSSADNAQLLRYKQHGLPLPYNYNLDANPSLARASRRPHGMPPAGFPPGYS